MGGQGARGHRATHKENREEDKNPATQQMKVTGPFILEPCKTCTFLSSWKIKMNTSALSPGKLGLSGHFSSPHIGGIKLHGPEEETGTQLTRSRTWI